MASSSSSLESRWTLESQESLSGIQVLSQSCSGCDHADKADDETVSQETLLDAMHLQLSKEYVTMTETKLHSLLENFVWNASSESL